jgi:molybdopterin converting factor small subunit
MSSGAHISVSVRLYSILRQRDGRIVDSLELTLPMGSRAADVLSILDVPLDLEIILAVNDVVSSDTVVLKDGDRLAIIPAVAGGDQR